MSGKASLAENLDARGLPTGTVTFLFTDIEGSVTLWERDPAAMQSALARHAAIIQGAITTHGGRMFKVVGDAFQAAFAAPVHAIEAAVAAQRILASAEWGATGPLRVRMGMHSGLAEVRDGDYEVSHTLNRTARVTSAGHGGQILLTRAVVELLRGQLPNDVDLMDLGEHYLKGLAQPESLFQVIAPGLPHDFPPLASQIRPRHNLPRSLTPFIGREKEVAQVRRKLAEASLVTLTGAGGVGKTRLALRIASEALADYADGVWWVELAPLADPALMAQSVALVLDVHAGPGRSPLQALTDHLHVKHMLLALDNCEHLIEACASLADALLHACPKLTLLATSREPLGVQGEVIFRVPSLSFPDPRHLPPVHDLMDYEAVRLFVERAEAVAPGFKMTLQNAPSLAQVCQRLDGIPLAIELAAARSNVLPIEQIAARLNDRFRLLTSGSRNVLARHQTLRALIDWSYDSLSEEEKCVLQRLSVFVGGWTLEAAEAVLEDHSSDVLDVLGQLVNKSLVIADQQSAPEAHYRLLESLREYARDKLIESGGAEAARDRHLSYFVQLAELAAPKLRGSEQIATLDRLERELDNFRSALEWSLSSEGDGGRDVEAGLRLAAALLWFWHIRSRKSEGSQWLELALSAEAAIRAVQPSSPSRTLARAGALAAAGVLEGMQANQAKAVALSQEALQLSRELVSAGGVTAQAKNCMALALWDLANAAQNEQDFDRAQRLAEESLALHREAGDRFGMAESLVLLANCAWVAGDSERAQALLEEGFALREEMGDQDGLAITWFCFGDLAFRKGDLDQASAMYERSLALFREVGNKWAAGQTLSGLGAVALARGQYEQAVRCYDEALALGQDVGDKYVIARSRYDLGEIARSRGDYGRATQEYEQALALVREAGDKSAIAGVLCGLGNVALAEGDYEAAAGRYGEALTIGRDMNGKYTIAGALHGLAKVAGAKGDYALACSLHKEALTLQTEMLDRLGAVYTLEALAILAVAQGQADRAARLFGAVEPSHDQLRLTRSPFERNEHERALAAVRAQLDGAAFAAAWDKGRIMSLEQAISYARGCDAQQPA